MAQENDAQLYSTSVDELRRQYPDFLDAYEESGIKYLDQSAHDKFIQAYADMKAPALFKGFSPVEIRDVKKPELVKTLSSMVSPSTIKTAPQDEEGILSGSLGRTLLSAGNQFVSKVASIPEIPLRIARSLLGSEGMSEPGSVNYVPLVSERMRAIDEETNPGLTKNEREVADVASEVAAFTAESAAGGKVAGELTKGLAKKVAKERMPGLFYKGFTRESVPRRLANSAAKFVVDATELYRTKPLEAAANDFLASLGYTATERLAEKYKVSHPAFWGLVGAVVASVPFAAIRGVSAIRDTKTGERLFTDEFGNYITNEKELMAAAEEAAKYQAETGLGLPTPQATGNRQLAEKATALSHGGNVGAMQEVKDANIGKVRVAFVPNLPEEGAVEAGLAPVAQAKKEFKINLKNQVDEFGNKIVAGAEQAEKQAAESTAVAAGEKAAAETALGKSQDALIGYEEEARRILGDMSKLTADEAAKKTDAFKTMMQTLESSGQNKAEASATLQDLLLKRQKRLNEEATGAYGEADMAGFEYGDETTQKLLDDILGLKRSKAYLGANKTIGPEIKEIGDKLGAILEESNAAVAAKYNGKETAQAVKDAKDILAGKEPKAEGKSVVEFIRSRGGILDLKKQMADPPRGLNRRSRTEKNPGFASLDEAGEALHQAGYVLNSGERPTERQVLDAILDEVGIGKKLYSEVSNEAKIANIQAEKDMAMQLKNQIENHGLTLDSPVKDIAHALQRDAMAEAGADTRHLTALDMHSARSDLLEAQRAAERSGANKKSRFYGMAAKIFDELLEQMGEEGSEEALSAIMKGNALVRFVKTRIEQDVTGKALLKKTASGDLLLADGTAGSVVFKPGSVGSTTVQRYLGAFSGADMVPGDEEAGKEAASALSDYALSMLSEAMNNAQTDQARAGVYQTFLKKFGPAIDSVPGLAELLKDPSTLKVVQFVNAAGAPEKIIGGLGSEGAAVTREGLRAWKARYGDVLKKSPELAGWISRADSALSDLALTKELLSVPVDGRARWMVRNRARLAEANPDIIRAFSEGGDSARKAKALDAMLGNPGSAKDILAKDFPDLAESLGGIAQDLSSSSNMASITIELADAHAKGQLTSQKITDVLVKNKGSLESDPALAKLAADIKAGRDVTNQLENYGVFKTSNALLDEDSIAAKRAFEFWTSKNPDEAVSGIVDSANQAVAQKTAKLIMDEVKDNEAAKKAIRESFWKKLYEKSGLGNRDLNAIDLAKAGDAIEAELRRMGEAGRIILGEDYDFFTAMVATLKRQAMPSPTNTPTSSKASQIFHDLLRFVYYGTHRNPIALATEYGSRAAVDAAKGGGEAATQSRMAAALSDPAEALNLFRRWQGQKAWANDAAITRYSAYATGRDLQETEKKKAEQEKKRKGINKYAPKRPSTAP